MVNFQSPGVYIREIESGPRPVEVTGTSTAALLGYAQTGEVMTPTPIENFDQYKEKFGVITENGNKKPDIMAFSVDGFFKNGGSLAYVLNISTEGLKSSATLKAGRKDPPEQLFIVNAKNTGSHMNGLEIWLIPEDGPDSGIFMLKVLRRTDKILKEEESFGPVYLAPGMTEGLIQMVKSNSKLIEIEPDDCDEKVFPSILFDLSGSSSDINAFKSANITLTILNKYSPPPFKFTELDPADITKAAEYIQQVLNEKKSMTDAPSLGLDFYCKTRSGKKILCLLKSTIPAACFKIIGASSSVISKPESDERRALLKQLITGTDGPDRKTAVLSKDIYAFDASMLRNKTLDLRIGDEFGRSLDFTGISKTLSLKKLAVLIQDELRRSELPLSKVTSVTVTSDESNTCCTLNFGPDALSGSTLEPQGSTPWLEQINSKEWQTPRILGDSYVGAALQIIGIKASDGTEENIKSIEFVDSVSNLITSISGCHADFKCTKVANTFKFQIQLKASPLKYNKFKIGKVDGKSSLGHILGLIDDDKEESDEIAVGDNLTSRTVATMVELRDKFKKVVGANTKYILELDLKYTNIPDPLRIEIDIENVDNIPKFKEAIESSLKVPPVDTVFVGVLGNRLLIWDTSNNIDILGTPGGDILNLTESRGAITEYLNIIQGEIPITGELQGGDDGKPGNESDYIDALNKLQKIKDVSIICLPGHYWSKGGESRSIIEAAIRHAEEQGDRMVIVDPPKLTSEKDFWKTEEAVNNEGLPISSYSALYYPWVKVAVPNSGNGSTKEVLVPPSGFAAGIWSKIDMQRGVWKAPAGVDARLAGISSLLHDVTDIQGGILNRLGVNVLRTLPGYGPVVWGGRTLSTRTQPQWKYLSIRRTALMIEDSLRNYLVWAVHQPNKSDLWSIIRINVEAFMKRLFIAGAFQPENASDAYFVRCGKPSTMNQEDIDAGIVRVRVGFAPVKSAEFIVIEIEQISENY